MSDELRPEQIHLGWLWWFDVEDWCGWCCGFGWGRLGVAVEERSQFFEVLFPLLHPAAALHQGSMLEPLREDFKKLRAFLDRHSQPAPAEATTPSAPILNIEPPQPTQMDLFGS